MNISCGWCGTMIPGKNSITLSKKRNEKFVNLVFIKTQDLNIDNIILYEIVLGGLYYTPSVLSSHNTKLSPYPK